MKIILHTSANPQEIEERRLLEEFALSPEERIKRMFKLMKMALKFQSKALSKNENTKIILTLRK